MPYEVAGATAQAVLEWQDQMGIMTHKAPIGIFFHTLKNKDENSPLEPKWCFYCLERVPGK